MRQLTFVEKGKLEWRDGPDPALEGDGQALVRPLALATCDIDTAFVQGRRRWVAPSRSGTSAWAR